MNDIDTRSVVSYIFSVMGYPKLSKFVKKDKSDLTIYINCIREKSKNYPHLQDFINYFL